MKKSIVISALLFLAVSAVMISCSADGIMNAGGKLETLGTAGLGKAGQKAVNNAVDSIGNVIVRYETCLKTPDKVETVLVTGQDGTQRATF
ncbi:MAG: hypothetical protein II493_02855, partial [Spirochaetales bacterium]|nr:hypothetical protein [Spirochaetales bacterium]